MRRETQNLLLLLLGGVVLRVTLDGTYLRYVKAGLAPFLLVSGFGIVTLAVVAIVGDIGGRHAGEHAHGTGRAPWLLLAPVAVLLLVVPPALGANAAGSTAPVRLRIAEEPETWPFPPLPPGEAPALPLTGLVDRALFDSARSLDDREVTVSGFVLAAEHGDGIDLARVVITCCVADARYIRVHLAGITEPLAEDSWLEVRGTVATASIHGDPEPTPTMTVTEYRRIERPENSYERGR
ncbi:MULTISPECIES: TIGR03943 family putative permease subunit [Nocardia]|uniref:TIGR03943 family putative permease subunit n=1 Tax=Nocardia TaxID=1817 RepID=UPI000D687DCF|nr:MULTISPECIES: TIGR03943 family protein [Nocardia]